jgi:hypothetical protein
MNESDIDTAKRFIYGGLCGFAGVTIAFLIQWIA